MDACQRPDLYEKTEKQLNNMHVCELHFSDIMYESNKRFLKPFAFPTLNMPSRSVIAVATQTNQTYDPNEALQVTRKKEKMHFLKKCDKYLTPNLSKVVKSLTIAKKRLKKVKKYTKTFKLFSLGLYFSNPQAYNFVADTLCLPPKRKLVMTQIPISSKIGEYVSNVLQQAAQCMSPSEKECVLCIGIMGVKPSLSYGLQQDKIVGLHEVDGVQDLFPAGYAFTLMLSGMTSDWNQVIGYAFIKSKKIDEQLRTWITDTIKQLFTLGFKIRALVSRPGIQYLKFTESVGISNSKPFFEVDGNRIYYIFDVPNLILKTRDSLIDYNFEFNGKTANWEHIYKLYHLDKEASIRSAPKLTNAHMIPNNFQKKKVRFAAQVFSDSVKAALETYVETELMKPCEGTIEFIGLMNDTFDLLNLPVTNDIKPYWNTNFQREILLKARRVLSNLIVRHKVTDEDITAHMDFINPFIVTINSVLKLQEGLEREPHYSLITRRLNIESLNRFFRIVRKMSNVSLDDKEPTCFQFERAFQKTFLCQINNLPSGKKQNVGFNTVLKRYNEFFNDENRTTIITQEQQFNKAVTMAMSYFKIPDFSDVVEHQQQKLKKIMYICGYLLKQSSMNHVCALRVAGFMQHEENIDPSVGYAIPPATFIVYLHELEMCFSKNFMPSLGKDVTKKLYDALQTVEVCHKTLPCSCFPLMFLLKLFIRIKIQHILKLNNLKFTGSKSESCRKVLSIVNL